MSPISRQFTCKLLNEGVITAFNVRYGFKFFNEDPTESNILKKLDGITLHNLDGIVTPSQRNKIECELLPLTSTHVNMILNVRYDDSEIKDREFVYVCRISETNSSEKIAYYDKEEIEKARKNIK